MLADYGQIVPAELLDLPHGALNLHPSLLPRHRGATPIPAAILAGDRETGVSLMRMDAGLDTGPLVAVERVSLAGDETAPALEARLAIVAAGLLARSLEPWLAGEIEPEPQPADGATPDPAAPPRRRPPRPATARRWLLERQVRAYLPWPGTLRRDRRRSAGRARRPSVTRPMPTTSPAGSSRTTRASRLATVDGRLVLDEVQPAGGRPMTGEAFLRGRPAVLGRSLADARPRVEPSSAEPA